VDSLYLLIPVALLFCAIAIKLLLWAINSGQYDDLDKEAWRILAEDEPPAPAASEQETDVAPASDKP
jgi:cbb3-type cytochrome oxidase maturation protein